MTSPHITVIMPSFSQATYLEEAICSALNQGYPDLEHEASFSHFDTGNTQETHLYGTNVLVPRVLKSNKIDSRE